MGKNSKIYCIFCGEKNFRQSKTCCKCGKSLNEKDHLWKEYLFNHTKDDLKDKLTNSFLSTLKNYIESHLYGTFITLSVVMGTSFAVINQYSNSPIKTIEKMPDVSFACREKVFSNKFSYIYESEEVCIKEAQGEPFFYVSDYINDKIFAIGCEQITDECGNTYWGAHFLSWDHEKNEPIVNYY